MIFGPLLEAETAFYVHGWLISRFSPFVVQKQNLINFMMSSAVAVRPEEIKKRINSEKKLLTTTIYTYEFDQVIKKKFQKKKKKIQVHI